MGFVKLSMLLVLVFPNLGPDEDFQERLKRAVEGYRLKRDAINQDIGEGFKRELAKVRRARMEPTAKTQLINSIIKAQAEFANSNRFPDVDALAELRYNYSKALNGAAQPVFSVYEREIGAANAEGNLGLARTLIADRESFLRELIGRNLPHAGMEVRGTKLRQNLSTCPLHIKLTDYAQGGAFEALVEDNPGVQGHWRYKAAGRVSGLRVTYELTLSLRGEFSRVVADGFMADGVMVLRLVQTHKGKRNELGWFVGKVN